MEMNIWKNMYELLSTAKVITETDPGCKLGNKTLRRRLRVDYETHPECSPATYLLGAALCLHTEKAEITLVHNLNVNMTKNRKHRNTTGVLPDI